MEPEQKKKKSVAIEVAIPDYTYKILIETVRYDHIFTPVMLISGNFLTCLIIFSVD